MTILDTIIAHKFMEVAERKAQVTVASLEQQPNFARTRYSLTASLKQPNASGIIAEIKRKSPSQGIIHPNVSVEALASGYEQAGVSGISVLTDHKFFGGTDDDLRAARNTVQVPLLRKEFIVDEYQIIEAKALGADVILLIAACLSPDQINQFTALAHSLGLEVLLEVHNENELTDNLESGADLLGVNNRNLKTFVVSVETSKRMIDRIPDSFLKISESGIDAVETAAELRALGYDGFLMGQNFMKHDQPGQACEQFIQQLKMWKS
ncbi:MAG: indole-3-glycerol phosphate synthase TrpC [Cyclobacteriaceae bacterium]|jgi:indole-3-glycerol phosphate synthase|nr:indole-3-glycerol phosphate synthase TrpC [Cyclobacteriaceae bacterium]